MILNCDIHCHSGYSGGVGKISLDKLYDSLKLKGINLYGSADVLHPLWKKTLEDSLIESERGLFILRKYKKEKENRVEFLPRIILQTEVVLTAPYYFDNKKRKIVHLIILFPSFEAVESFIECCQSLNVKFSIGRPYLKFSSLKQIEDFFMNLSLNFPEIEFIPAHIFTPDGILGGENPLDSMDQFFGEFTLKINAIESGLSADPNMIFSIDELSKYLVISNSDAHSEALNRIGREFFSIEIDELNYENIINSIRKKRILFTVEFKPEHGRYFLTGHNSKRHTNGQQVYFRANQVPDDLICPLCGKKMIAGVEYRVHTLSQKKLVRQKSQKYFYSIPLLEVIATSLKISITSKKAEYIYRTIISEIGYESKIYIMKIEEFKELIDKINIPFEVKKSLISIRNNNFKFEPAGYDGEYGNLVIE